MSFPSSGGGGGRGPAGPAGPPGTNALDQNIPLGTVLGTVLHSDGVTKVAGPTALVEEDETFDSGKSISLPDTSVNFLNLRISASQGRMLIYDMLNEVYLLVGSRPLTAAGTGDFLIERAGARQGPTLFQGRDDLEFTTTDLSFNFRNITAAIIDNWITRGSAGRFYVQIHEGTDATGRVLYRSHLPSDIATGNVFQWHSL